MATEFKKLQMDVELKVKGLRKLEGDVVNTFKNLPNMIKSMPKGDMFAGMRAGLNRMDGDLNKFYRDQETLANKFATALQQVKVDDKAGVPKKKQLERFMVAIDGLDGKYKELAASIVKTSGLFRAQEAAATQTYQSILVSANQSLLSMRQYGATIKSVTQFHSKLKAAAASPSAKADVTALNTEFAKRAGILQDIEIISRRLRDSDLPKAKVKGYTAELRKVKKAAQDTDVSINTLALQMKEIKVTGNAVKGLNKINEKITTSIQRMKDFGGTELQIAKVTTAFNNLAISTALSGDTTKLDAFNISMKARERILKSVVAEQKKLAESKLGTVDKSAGTTALSKIKAQALDLRLPDVGAIALQLEKVSAGTVELLRLEKDYKSSIDASTTAIGRRIEALKRERASIEAKLKDRGSRISSVDKERATKELQAINSAIASASSSLDNINSKPIISEAAATKAAGELKAIDETLKKIKVSAGDTKIAIQYSGTVKELKVAFGGLTKQLEALSGVNKEFIKGNVGYDALTEEIRKQQALLAKGGKANTEIARKSAIDMQKRIKAYVLLNQEADKLTEEANSYGAEMGQNKIALLDGAKSLRVAAGLQLDITKSAEEHAVSVKKARGEVKALQGTLSKVEGVEKEVLRLLNNYENKLGDINRLRNAKTRWAKGTDLEAARKLAVKYETQLQKVVATMDKLKAMKLRVDVDPAELAAVKKEAAAAKIELQKLAHQGKEVKASLANISGVKWLKNIGQRAMAYAGIYASFYQLISLLRSGITAVVQFDTQVRTMAAVFDMSASSAKVLGYELVGLSKAWGGAVTDINEAALALGRAGIATDKVTEATEIVIKMARLTGDSIAVSANAMITYQQVFGDTHPVLKELGDQLAYVANQSRLSTQDIGTFSNYALATAKSAGITMEAINAMAISFSNAGVNASTIGTQIRRFSTLLKNNSTSAQEFFQKMGTSQEIFSNKLQAGAASSNAAMKDLIGKLKNLSDVEFTKAVAGMDILATNSITLLRNNADAYMEHFDALSAGVSGEIDKANLISESYASSYEKLGAAAGEAFEKMTQTVAPMIQSFMGALQGAFEWLGNNGVRVIDGMTDAFKAMLVVMAAVKAEAIVVFATGRLTALGAAYASLAASVATARTALASFFLLAKSATILTTLKAAVVGLRLAFMSLMSIPAVAALVAIGTAAYFVYDALTDTTEATKNLTAAQIEAAGRSAKMAESLAGKERQLAKEKMVLVNLIELQQTANTKANAAARIESEAKIKNLVTQINLEKQLVTVAQQNRAAAKIQVEKKTVEVKLEMEKSKPEGVQDLVAIDKLEKQLVSFQKKAENLQIRVQKGDIEQVMYDLKNEGKQLQSVLDRMAEAPGFSKLSEGFKIFTARLNTNKKAAKQVKEVYDGLGTAMDTDKVSTVWALMSKRMFQSVDSMGKSIISLNKNGVDVAAPFMYFTKQMEGFAKTIQETFTGTMVEHMTDVSTALGELQLSPEAQEEVNGFSSAMNQLMNAKGDVNEFGKGLLKLSMHMAELENMKGVNQNFITKLKGLFHDAERASKGFVMVADSARKVGVALNDIPNAKDILGDVDRITGTLAGIKIGYAGIVDKMTEGVDLTYQIKNATMTVKQANDLVNNATVVQAKNMQILVNLGILYKNVMEGISDGSYSQAEADGILRSMQYWVNTMDANTKNIKAADSKLKSIKGHAKSSAKSAEREQKSREKIEEHLEKTKALIASLKGDNLLKYAVEAKKVFKELFEEMDSEDAIEQAAKYVENKMYSLDKIRGEQLAQDSGNPLAIEMKEWEDRLQVVKDHYDARAGILKGHQDAIAQQIKKGGISKLDGEQRIADLGVQIEAEAAKKKEAIQKQSMDNYISMAGKVMTELNTVMGQFYDAMYGDAKGSYEAQMEVVGTVREEIATNEAQLQDLYAIRDANPDLIVDAQIAQLEAKDKALGDNLTMEEKKAAQDKDNEAKAKAMFETMQKIQVATAIASTYLSAQQAFQSAFLPVPGPWSMPLGIGLAAAAIGIGMGNVAQIAAQKYHTGGYVDQPNISGMGGKRDDEITATLQKGEYVLSKEDVRNIKQSYNKQGTDSNTQASMFAQLADSLKQEVVIVNSMDPSVVEDWATSRRGREIIHNVVNA